MRTSVLAWDYTRHASNYDARADYSASLLDDVLHGLALPPDAWVLEVGAGTGKLSVHLLKHCKHLIALEPNTAMRAVALGKAQLHRAHWIAAMGEKLPVAHNKMDVIAYGSSFNVLPAQLALQEAARVLKSGGHWLALWNHRDLSDSLQCQVEAIIRHHIPTFDSGTRRQSPVQELVAHGGFTQARAFEQRFVVTMPTSTWLHAWQAHATLQRQAGDRLDAILKDIRQLVAHTLILQVPYFTRIWTSQKK